MRVLGFSVNLTENIECFEWREDFCVGVWPDFGGPVFASKTFQLLTRLIDIHMVGYCAF